MFLIDRAKNEAVPLERHSFTDMKFRERSNLQEWIDKNPAILGIPLLIIQKEFHGFDHTNERLDLLALDKQGNLVVIENKIDDSGRDVVWQALKYASYCAGMSKQDIVEVYGGYLNSKGRSESAEQNIVDFLEADSFDELTLNGGDQSIVLVASSFRSEVTSTVMWLLDHQVKVTCVEVTLHKLGEQVFLETDQILPPPDTEEYRIRLTKKRQVNALADEDKQVNTSLRLSFWMKALPELRTLTGMYQNVTPSKDSWINGASGHTGIAYNCVASKEFLRVELYIDMNDAERNKALYDHLHAQKSAIEATFGTSLDWTRLDTKRASRIFVVCRDYDMADEQDWPKMIAYLGDRLKRMKDAFQNPIAEYMKARKMENGK